jgi:hypothetical protein
MMLSCGIENRCQRAGDISGMLHRPQGRDCLTIPIARDARSSYAAAAMATVMPIDIGNVLNRDFSSSIVASR